MSRYIDIVPLEKELKKAVSKIEEKFGKENYVKKTLEMVCKNIELKPTADVATVVRAHWRFIFNKHTNFCIRYICSNCKNSVIVPYPNCPYCGAKMDEKEN